MFKCGNQKTVTPNIVPQSASFFGIYEALRYAQGDQPAFGQER